MYAAKNKSYSPQGVLFTRGTPTNCKKKRSASLGSGNDVRILPGVLSYDETRIAKALGRGDMGSEGAIRAGGGSDGKDTCHYTGADKFYLTENHQKDWFYVRRAIIFTYYEESTGAGKKKHEGTVTGGEL